MNYSTPKLLGIVPMIIVALFAFSSNVSFVNAQEEVVNGLEAGFVLQDLAITSASTSASSTETEEITDNSSEVIVNFDCEIEGHKYDQLGNPLSDWQIGLIKVYTQGDNQDILDLAVDTTDGDGHYCLSWDDDSHDNLRGGGERTIVGGNFSYIFRVYEKMMTGWKNISIEKGSSYNNLIAVTETDIQTSEDEVSVQVGEENVYLDLNSAYHVDFYNKKDEEVVACVDNEEVVCDVPEVVDGSGSGHRSNSSGTRVNRNATPEPLVLGTSTSTPEILGEQVSVIPVGAPDTGAGGTSGSGLTLSQILLVSRRFSF